jgi:hypothetical protein
MFKNESSIIKQWIEHYLDEGVDHFYLIDNGSTDNYEDEIKDYMKYITLIKDSIRHKVVNCWGTQQILENKYYLEKVKKESEWVFICDLDEFLFSTKHNTLITCLKNSKFDCIKIPFIYFGSKYINTSKNICISLNLSENYETKKLPKTLERFAGEKSILKTKYLKLIDCHDHNLNTNKIFRCNYNDICDFRLNHYQIISKDYYNNIRCVRGGGVHGTSSKNYQLELYNEKNNKFTEKENNILRDKKLNKIYIKKNLSLYFNKWINYKYIYI